MNNKVLSSSALAALLLTASASLFAASTTYEYVITGDVLLGEEVATADNDFNIFAPDTITAYGTFTVDSSFNGGTIFFGLGSGNSMTIDLNGTLLEANDAFGFLQGAAPSLTFTAGWHLADFSFAVIHEPDFESHGTFFGDSTYTNLSGEWRTGASIAAVPEASSYGMILAGLGLVGFAVTRRRPLLARV